MRRYSSTMASEGEMSTAAFRIAYDGEALASHTMDVRDLAPSLLALGEIFVEANRLLNGKEAAVEVHVTPKIEENCFDIGLEVIQKWEVLKKLIGQDDAVAAKDLVDWLFIGKAVLCTSVVGSLVCLYRVLKGKKPINIFVFNDEYGNRLYRYQFENSEDQILDEKMHLLYGSNKIRNQLGKMLRPVTQRPGVSEFIAYDSADKDASFKITKAEAVDIDFSPIEPEPEELPETGEVIDATLRVYSPVYDLNAPRWRFWYGKDHHYMDVSESNIREVVLNSGGALMDDRFRVRLQAVDREQESGEKSQDFKVLEVLEFIPASRQSDLFLTPGSSNDDAS